MLKIEKKSQKWIILFLVWLGVFMTTYAQNQTSALSTGLMESFGLTPEQYSSIYTAPNWVAVFLGIFVGVLSDKIGVRKMITFAGMLCIVGSVGRIFSTTFVPLFVFNLLTGFVACTVSCNRAKILGTWFSREEMGLAMGLCMTVSPIASTLALGTTSLLPSIQFSFSIVAVIAVIFFISWLLFGKEKPDDMGLPPNQSVWSSLSSVAKNPWVWVLAIAGFVVMCAQVTTMAFISAAIQSRGFTPAAAGALATGLTISCGVGGIVTPIIVKKIGRYKPVIAAYTIIGAVCVFFGWQMPSIIGLYGVLFGAGFVLGSLLTLLFTFPIFLVGQERVSTATGIISTIQLLGAAIGLTYIIMPITGMDFTKLFGAAAICLAISGFLMFLIPELGEKGKAKTE